VISKSKTVLAPYGSFDFDGMSNLRALPADLVDCEFGPAM
jgi:hypothetical protein